MENGKNEAALEEEIRLLKDLRKLISKVGHAAKSTEKIKHDKIPELFSNITQCVIKVAEKSANLENVKIPSSFVQVAKLGRARSTVTGFCGEMTDNVVFMNQVCRGKTKAFEEFRKQLGKEVADNQEESYPQYID